MAPASPRDGALANPAPDPDRSLFLLRLARAGDAAALDELVRRYEPRVRRIVRARLPANLAARVDEMDLVNATLHAASRQLGGFEPRGAASLLHWLARIAENKIKDELAKLHAQRRECRREVPLAASSGSSTTVAWQPAAREPTPSAFLFRKELEKLFDDAVRELPGDQREAVILRDYCSADWDEIALRLGRTNAHAACQLHQRAWIALRRTLGPKLRDCV